MPGIQLCQQCSYQGLSIVSSAVSYLGLQYHLLSRITRRVCSTGILTAWLYDEGCIVFTFKFISETPIWTYSYVSSVELWHICMVKGVLFSLFTSSLTLVLGPAIKSPQQYWYLGLGYCLLSNALICAFDLSPKVSSYLGLKNCHRSIYPRGICSIVIPAAYLNAEGCIVFTFHFISKAHISVYKIVSSAVQIAVL